MQHVFLVGTKSLGVYGGYEIFINILTKYHQSNPDIKYHVAVKVNGQGASVLDGVEVINGRYTYHNADCFQIKIPEKLGSAQAIYYDCAALAQFIKIIKQQNIKHPIIYIMTCRIGPFFEHYAKKVRGWEEKDRWKRRIHATSSLSEASLSDSMEVMRHLWIA